MLPVSDKVLFGHDELTGITEWFVSDESGDNFKWVIEGDAQPSIDRTKDIQNSMDQSKWGDGLQHVASIPMVIYWDWKRKGWIDDPVKLRTLLNDPDNRFMRTKLGDI